jgi:hypothetical protein
MLMVRTPVRMLGLGTGAYRSECSDGNGAAPSFFDAAYLSGATVPSPPAHCWARGQYVR